MTNDSVKQLSYRQEWRANNKEKMILINQRYYRKRKIKEKGIDTSLLLTDEDWQAAWDKLEAETRMNRIVKAATVPIDTSFFPPMPPPFRRPRF